MSLPAGLQQLIDIIGRDHVLTDADMTAGYETDWTGRFHGTALAVVRPGDTDEVAAVVGHCDGAGLPIVTQGGNTGLVGGSVPRERPMIVLSTRRLRSVGQVDRSAQQVSLGAGTTITEWRDVARAAGLDTPVDFASRDSATVGGAVATNAGGSRVVRFGTMRSQVVGVRAVLADGRIVGSMAGLAKDTVGLHWPSLLSGSEGTLGVISDVRLRLVPWYRARAAVLVSVTGMDVAVRILEAVRSSLSSLDTVEVILAEAIDLVSAHLGRTPPVERGDVYVFVEAAAHGDPMDDLLAALGEAGDDGVIDSAVAGDGPAIDALFEFRDRVTEAISAAGVPLKLDVAVPTSALESLVYAARRSVDRHGGRLIPFGHLAEGNLHLNVLDVVDVAQRTAITEDVLTAAADLGGTISAEHGVGVAKVPWVPLVRTPHERSAAIALKRALDPHATLNPGVLHPPDSPPIKHVFGRYRST